MGGLVFLAAPLVLLFVWCVFFGEWRARRRKKKWYKKTRRELDELERRRRERVPTEAELYHAKLADDRRRHEKRKELQSYIDHLRYTCPAQLDREWDKLERELDELDRY